jgi:hypothetical protein
MANTLLIEKETGGYYGFTLTIDGVVQDKIRNMFNDAFGKNNLVTINNSTGANLVKKQNISVFDITLIASGTFTFTDIDDFLVKLIDIGFFDWRLGTGGGSGATRFDDLLDTFQYFGQDGKGVRVNESEQKLETYDIYNYRNITDLEDTYDVGIPNKMLVTDNDGNVVLEDKITIPQPFLNSIGSFLYADLATQTTPLNGIANVEKNLTNDIDGVETDLSNSPYGVSTTWNSATNRLDFSQLSIGDVVDLRVFLSVTTTVANQNIQVYARVGLGTTSEKDFLIGSTLRTTAGLFIFEEELKIVISKEDYITAIGEIYLFSENNSTIKVNYFEFVVTRKNINVIDIDGLTDLSATRTPTNVSINSSTGTPAVIGLGNGTNAGVSSNDYTTAEKAKLADTYIKSEVDNFLDLKANITNTLQAENTTSGIIILTLTDAGTTIPFNLNGVIKTVTVPLDSSVAFPIGTTIGLYNANIGGTQQVLISGAGVTFINNDGTLRPGDLVILLKTKTNTWLVQNTIKTYPVFVGTVVSNDFNRAFRANGNGSFCFSDGVSGMKLSNSGIAFDAWFSSSSGNFFNFLVEYYFNTSGNTNVINFSDTFNPTSGTGTTNICNLSPIINKTGGANGITRSIYINPILTSAFDFRAIEVTLGKSIFQEVILQKPIQHKQYTVATLPTVVQGNEAYVTDALTPTYLGIAVGGGAVVCKVFFNGTNWIT